MTKERDVDYTVPPWGLWGRNFTLGVVSGGSKLILHLLNTLHVEGEERVRQYILDREHGRPLFTVCNHISTLDDPVVLSGMLPWSFFWTESHHKGVRWSLCAREICYKTMIIRDVFQNGKTLPIDRGGGITQPIMLTAAAKAAQGEWIHVFPESKISYTGRLLPLRRGIGKLICDSVRDNPKEPIVLPFYHSGMGRILPKGSVIPRVGHSVHVKVGTPIELQDLTSKCNCSRYKQSEVWSMISERIADALTRLEKEAPANWDQVHKQSTLKNATPPPVKTEESPQA